MNVSWRFIKMQTLKFWVKNILSPTGIEPRPGTHYIQVVHLYIGCMSYQFDYRDAESDTTMKLYINHSSLKPHIATHPIINVSIQSAPRPADWKTHTGSGGGSVWVRLNSNINIDVTIVVSRDSKSTTLLKQIQVCCCLLKLSLL